MSNHGPEGRSYKNIETSDLEQLLTIAESDIADFFRRRRDWAELYQERLLGFALCQGAANHYIGRGDGVQDFDVFAFFAENSAKPWYAKRHVTKDFGDGKFGQSLSCPTFVGRRVDLLSRSVPALPRSDLRPAIRNWLESGSSKSAKLLSQKAVVLLCPRESLGEVVWPVPHMRGRAVDAA